MYHYANYKRVYEVSSYVKLIDLSEFRCCIANFRSCAHNVMIEDGRYMGLIPEQRTCPYCETCAEDEYHFMLECPLYTNIRQKYLPNVNNNLPLNVFYILMASDNVNIIRILPCTYIMH